MTSQNFFICLQEERSIFRVFSSYAEIGNFQAFCSQGLNQVAHWNLAYPTVFGNEQPSSQELEDLARHYKSKRTPGHLAVFEKGKATGFAEESEYFALQGPPIIEKNSKVQEMSHIESELDQFCDLIQICFSLEDAMIAYFKKKMALLQNRPGSKFYIMKIKNRIVGGCSVFITDNGSAFMFNVATHPSMQGQGIAQEIIGYAAKISPRPLYTYSHNSAMRDSILPKLGFQSLGILWCVPLDVRPSEN